MIINYHQQPTGNTCGPACIKMVHSSIHGIQNSSQITIPQIANMCGTDWIVGTPPDRMENGLKSLSINYIINEGNEDPFKSIQESISCENFVILRTITKGNPHWIILDSHGDGFYNVLDPWLGRIQYTTKELNEIWKVRNYFYFEIPKQDERIRV